ncbi:MAG: nicotinate-nicotinamide nucleotide adenylyltransferase [Actinomycetota bacterium]
MSATLLDGFDAASIATLRSILGRLDPEGTPELVPLQPARKNGAVALIPGSFNPPTSAHSALAELARSEGYRSSWFVYARRTLAKAPSGLIPEDRLLAMRLACSDGVGTAVSSHGLLVDQAEAAWRAFDAGEIGFVIGSDKFEQLFEDRWYPDRDEALERLFARAVVIVAPRHGHGEKVRYLLQRPDVRRFSSRIEVRHLHPSVSEISSTRVRQILRAGGPPTGLVPTGVEALLRDTGAFGPPTKIGREDVDRYQLRQRLLGLVLDGRCTRDAPDLHSLWRLALDPGEAGRSLRELLNAS